MNFVSKKNFEAFKANKLSNSLITLFKEDQSTAHGKVGYAIPFIVQYLAMLISFK